MRKLWKSLAAVLALALIFLVFAPGLIESRLNQKSDLGLSPPSNAAQRLHDTLAVADLHTDTLLWYRNPLTQSDRGHADIPRLRQSNVAVQVFAAVTKSPRGQNYDANTADSDNITSLIAIQRWPPRTWSSLLERAVYQADRLRKATRESNDIRLLLTRAQLQEHMQDWQPGGAVGGILALEGAHPLEQKLANLEVLFAAGYRIIGLQHFFDNALGGSLHGTSKSGLTAFGREVVSAAVNMGFIVDVAHSSPAVVDDVLGLTDKPVIVSHTGIKGACDTARNLEDSQFQAIAAAGGLVGIGFWDAAVCDIAPEGIAASIAYAVAMLGEQAVALGSDYDGSTTVAIDAGELVQLTDALLAAGLSERQVRLVMGQNQIRFLLQHLPD